MREAGGRVEPRGDAGGEGRARVGGWGDGLGQAEERDPAARLVGGQTLEVLGPDGEAEVAQGLLGGGQADLDLAQLGLGCYQLRRGDDADHSP